MVQRVRYSVESPRAAVPNLFGTRDRFFRRQFFHTPGVRGVLSGWFKHITFLVHFISNLMSVLIWQEAPVHTQRLGTPALEALRPRLDPQLCSFPQGWAQGEACGKCPGCFLLKLLIIIISTVVKRESWSRGAFQAPAYWEQKAVPVSLSLFCDPHFPSLPSLLFYARGAEARKVELCDFFWVVPWEPPKWYKVQWLPWRLIASRKWRPEKNIQVTGEPAKRNGKESNMRS